MTEQDIPDYLLDDDEEVTLGSREDALIDENNVEREWFKVDDKVYWFDMKEVSWERKSEILEENLTTDTRTGDVDLDLKGYYRDMMLEVIVDKSVEGSLPVFLKGMKPELGDQLQEAVPQPGTVMDDDTEGNSEPPSEADEAATPP